MKNAASRWLDPNLELDAYHGDESGSCETDAAAEALKELTHDAGPPLTTGELARITGMSSTFIRKEIDSGYLQAVRIGRGRKCVFRISVSEARRYLKALGLCLTE